MQYSGRTTCYEHKGDKDWTQTPNSGTECLQQQTIFEAQWSNCPIEVEKEVKQLWQNNELGNSSFFLWDSKTMNNNPSYPHQYPVIDEYLKSKGITECLIHWWW